MTELNHAYPQWKIGDRVRPKGEHIARTHIGRVIALTTPYTCPTCGTMWLEMVRVQWADGRLGDWSLGGLELVTADSEV